MRLLGLLVYFNCVAAVEFSASSLAGEFSKLADGSLAAREGLMVASNGGQLILTEDHVTHGIGFSGGKHRDGNTRTQAPAADLGLRSYHILLGPDAFSCLFLMGGQTSLQFFNDVWKTCDQAQTWVEVAKAAPWGARAGLGGSMHNGKLVIAGGCHDDVKSDPGVSSNCYSDVWSSSDGASWTLLTDNPGWKGRRGSRLVSFNSRLYIMAGEVGFTTSTQLVDVWRSADDGSTWSLMKAQPSYSARSGHGVLVLPVLGADCWLAGAFRHLFHEEWGRLDFESWTCMEL